MPSLALSPGVRTLLPWARRGAECSQDLAARGTLAVEASAIEVTTSRLKEDGQMLKLRTAWKALRRRLVGATETTRVAAQGMVEYGILVALIAVAALASIQTLGGGIAAFFGRLLVHFQGLG
jgi:Flp pilus assembly pilin Flp